MRILLGAALAPLLLAACGPAEEPQNTPAPEPWSNEAEVLFQEAEALKYALERQRLEQARLDALGVEGVAPAPGPDQQQPRK